MGAVRAPLTCSRPFLPSSRPALVSAFGSFLWPPRVCSALVYAAGCRHQATLSAAALCARGEGWLYVPEAPMAELHLPTVGLCWLPSPRCSISHALQMSPRIPSRINHLPSNPALRSCLWGNPNQSRLQYTEWRGHSIHVNPFTEPGAPPGSVGTVSVLFLLTLSLSPTQQRHCLPLLNPGSLSNKIQVFFLHTSRHSALLAAGTQ